MLHASINSEGKCIHIKYTRELEAGEKFEKCECGLIIHTAFVKKLQLCIYTCSNRLHSIFWINDYFQNRIHKTQNSVAFCKRVDVFSKCSCLLKT